MRNLTAAFFVGLGLACAGAVPAMAATTTFRSQTVAPGKPARIAVITALKRDCSTGPVGSVKVVTAPKNGSLVVRTGKLKTPPSFRCPNVETPAEALFYQPNASYSGPDEISYETRTPDGVVQSFTVRITVGGKPAESKPSDTKSPKGKEGDSLEL